MANEKKLATISILVKDRHSNAEGVNKLLTDNGHMIMARLGVNLNRACISDCMALITVAVEATDQELNKLTEDMNSLNGIVARSTVMTD